MYPKLLSNEEMYISDKYETDKFGNEIYALKFDRSEKYRMSGGKPIMAKRKNSNGKFVPYFATDKDGYPICPYTPDMTYIEINIPYPQSSNSLRQLYPRFYEDEFYIGLNGNCFYARDENNQTYYASNWRMEMYYAFQLNEAGQIIDYPRKNNKGEAVYIFQGDICIYPRNQSTKQVLFPLDSQGNETYIEINGKQFYAFSEESISVHAKNKIGNEILASNQGVPFYGFDLKDGKKCEIYPKLKNGIEFYKKVNNTEVVATDKNTGLGFYAKDTISKSEFYPKKFTNKKERKTAEKKKVVNLTLHDIVTHNASTNS